MIYLTILQDKEKANEFIKKAGLNEYPYGQNNYGLLNQFFLNNINDAEYFYQKAAKNKFALAEYNLGFLSETNGKINESIEFYLKASEYENEPLIFHNNYILHELFH